MDYICRKLSAGDIDLVVGMNRNFRPDFVNRESAAEFLSNPANWLFAAVDGGAVIGFAYGYELSRLDGAGRMLYIHEVGVTEARQRQGIGYRMMTELKAVCKQVGIGKYFLSAYQSNVAANALYRKLGCAVSAESGGNDTMYYLKIE
jgi:ribosomal protein S18 acetylase RimI-like enzyme